MIIAPVNPDMQPMQGCEEVLTKCPVQPVITECREEQQRDRGQIVEDIHEEQDLRAVQ